mgnify:CR=1 FL=1
MAVSFEKKIRSNTKSIIAKNGSAFLCVKRRYCYVEKGEMGENATGRFGNVLCGRMYGI